MSEDDLNANHRSWKEQSQPRYALGAATPMRVLAIKSGTLSLHYSYFDTGSDRALAWGTVGGIGTSAGQHNYHGPNGQLRESLSLASHGEAFLAVAKALTHPIQGVLVSLDQLDVIGHYVAHGGSQWTRPLFITDEAKRGIEECVTLAPLHIPANLLGIEECERLMPGIPQIAVFDTAFHQTMPPAAYAYPIPRDLNGKHELRRYGYHGILHEFAGNCAARHLGRSFGQLKMITCYLDHGASIAAIEYGRCIDTSMGLTPLEGMPTVTRSGSVDPGLVLQMQNRHSLTDTQLNEFLSRNSGLKALAKSSGADGDFSWDAKNGNSAVQYFCYQAKKYVGAYLAALGDADVLVFTGSVAQGQAAVRAQVCQDLAPVGILLDDAANADAVVGAGAVVEISDRRSHVRVLLVGADEQQMIARLAVETLQRTGVSFSQARRPRQSIPVTVSAHHVHLTKEHFERLFGAGKEMTWHADLGQPGQFACKENVTLVGPRGRIDRVRVLGPYRNASQVEISKTEAFKLGVNPPIRASGALQDTPGIRLEGSAGAVELERGVICALRHIHITPDDALAFGLRNKDVVSVQIRDGERSLGFGSVLVRVHPQSGLEMHIDTDEANAAGIPQGAVCYLDSIDERPDAEMHHNEASEGRHDPFAVPTGSAR